MGNLHAFFHWWGVSLPQPGLVPWPPLQLCSAQLGHSETLEGRAEGRSETSPSRKGLEKPTISGCLRGQAVAARRPGEAEALRNAECHVAQNRTQQLLTVGLGIRSREVGGHSLSLVSGQPAREPLATADGAVGGGPSRSHLHLPPSSDAGEGPRGRCQC